MKQIILLTIGILFGFMLNAQPDKIQDYVSKGIELHNQGKFNEAIACYKAALAIDKKSALANYELSYTYFVIKSYSEAIKYSKLALKHPNDIQHQAYVILGSSLDLTGKPEKAIKTYEQGLTKFPNSNLLNYNLALTCFNHGQLDKAEIAAINAISIKPTHGSSHVVLSAIMQEKGQRVKSMLPLYFLLMLEPNSQRSPLIYKNLLRQLGQGVEKKDDKNINVNISLSGSQTDEFSAAEMMISLLAASKFTEENKNKYEVELFVEANNGIFSILGELKKEQKGFWWDLYVTNFYSLVQTDNDEAFSYFISQSTGSKQVNEWIAKNPEKIQKLNDWMKVFVY
jgi:tetratricopeptide (TPR) repeat protein